MAKKDNNNDKNNETNIEVLNEELINDLQRIRADFENYRKRSEIDLNSNFEKGQSVIVLKLLPIIDDIERATGHIPEDLKNNNWANGILGLNKKLENALKEIGVEKIEASPGTEFNPDLHDAISYDEESVGEKEIIAEQLQPGYIYKGSPIRHSLVKVTKK